MKTLFTSCYGRSRAIPPELTQVRTSRGVPEFWKPARRIDAMPLAPNPAVMAAAKADPKGNSWKGQYRRQLETLYRSGVLERVIDNLPEQSVLMCFESDPCDCHRGILATFLAEKGLATVTEYRTPPPPPKKPVDPQLFLL